MKLKSQMEKQKSYAIRMKNKAKAEGDTEMVNYWLGVMNAMDWVQDSRDKWTYLDDSAMPKDEKYDF